MATTDDTIQATNDEASSSKAHAIRCGYWCDPYMKYFSLPVTRSPEINRGYFVRTQTFKAITIDFIKLTNSQCQVVNIGAGSDTLFFTLKAMDCLPIKYVEVDLRSNVLRKISVLRRCKELREMLDLEHNVDNPSGDPDACQTEVIADSGISKSACVHVVDILNTSRYCIFGFDLRRPVDELVERLCGTIPGLCPTTPTLFLAECVLVYIPPSGSFNLLAGLSSYFPSAAFVHYEQVNMNDRFGTVMIENFRARKCELHGLAACSSLASQEERFINAGWKHVRAWTVTETYNAFSTSTRLRIESVEMLDDLEIMKQLFDHYCIVFAVTDKKLWSWDYLNQPLSIIT